MPSPTAGLLLRLDGVVIDGDLAVQSFARHVCEQLPAELQRTVIAVMRGFLERRYELIPPDIDLSAAEDGDQAVQLIARASGLSPARIADARRASRVDLAGSVWALDPADGLDDLLAGLPGGVKVAVQVEPGDPAAEPVVQAVDRSHRVASITAEPLPAAARNLAAELSQEDSPSVLDKSENAFRTTPLGQILIIGARWSGALTAADAAGCATGLIDRFGVGAGTPTFRADGLSGLLPDVLAWAGRIDRRSHGGRS